MYFKNYFLPQIPKLLLGSFLILTSCGSYQNVPDNDGIYGSTEIPVSGTEQDIAVSSNSNSSSSYYKNYFKEKSSEYDVYTEDEVFTDVDEYGNEYAEASDSTEVDYNEYAGWGQENSNVSVNIYSGFNYGWNYPYNNWGWGYAGYGYGWGWNAGWGWGYPSYGWGYPGYGWAYCPPYYGGGYYGGGYYGGGYYGNYISYSNSRRGSLYAGRSSRYANNSSLGRYNIGRRSNTLGYTPGRPRADSNSSKPRVRSTTRTRTNSLSNPRTKSNSTPRVRTRSNSTPRTRTKTTSPTTRSYNNNSSPSRSYSSPSRGSSSMGSGRSSGGRSSGGRGGRGGF